MASQWNGSPYLRTVQQLQIAVITVSGKVPTHVNISAGGFQAILDVGKMEYNACWSERKPKKYSKCFQWELLTISSA